MRSEYHEGLVQISRVTSGVTEFDSLNRGTNKRIPNLLKMFYLIFWKGE